MTGSLLFAAPGCCLADFSAGGIVLRVLRNSAGLLLTGVCRVLRIVLRDYSRTEMAMGSDSPADHRSGADFNVELQVSDMLLFSECAMRWTTTIVSLRYPMSHCEGVISTISGCSLRSPRLWTGADRTRIRHSRHPYVAARLPRGASGGGTRMKIHPAARLAGHALPV